MTGDLNFDDTADFKESQSLILELFRKSVEQIIDDDEELREEYLAWDAIDKCEFVISFAFSVAYRTMHGHTPPEHNCQMMDFARELCLHNPEADA